MHVYAMDRNFILVFISFFQDLAINWDCEAIRLASSFNRTTGGDILAGVYGHVSAFTYLSSRV